MPPERDAVRESRDRALACELRGAKLYSLKPKIPIEYCQVRAVLRDGCQRIDLSLRVAC